MHGVARGGGGGSSVAVGIIGVPGLGLRNAVPLDLSATGESTTTSSGSEKKARGVTDAPLHFLLSSNASLFLPSKERRDWAGGEGRRRHMAASSARSSSVLPASLRGKQVQLEFFLNSAVLYTVAFVDQ